MRVSLLASAVLYPLAGESGVSELDHSSAAEFTIEAAAAVQEIQRLRAASTAFADRGGRLTTITFTTTRLFATAAEAELYCLDYDAAMPRAGTLVLAADGAADTHLLDALLDPPHRRTLGATAFLDYRATGGALVEG